ncbi:HNH endonuclease [Microbacterium sp. NPDC096154]|uniref:HNH endonuclease signature motif containing protein n=1 Tax=Microbacterium sp. NPDC096154 TaxID=3155549 RepID=UPI00331C208F
MVALVAPHAAPRFSMPKAVRITGRSSSITNSFVNGIIPVIPPTTDEIDEALAILGMDDAVVCAYCGDRATEWDHLRPLVVAQKPTGYISEIHNLVPACGKCNQSKGNKPWQAWMRGPAPLSPATRGVADIEGRIERLIRFENWGEPTKVDFAEVVGDELWEKHWQNHRAILELMREAEQTVELMRARIAASRGPIQPPPVGGAPTGAD